MTSQKKIRSILVLLAAAVCLFPLAAASYFNLSSLLGKNEFHASETVVNGASAAARHIETWLNLHLDALAMAGAPNAVDISLNEPRFSIDPEFVPMLVHDVAGLPKFAASYGHPFEADGFSVEKFVALVISRNRSTWSDLFVSPGTGRKVFAIGLPCKDGVAMGLLNASSLESAIEDFSQEHKLHVILIQTDGKIAAGAKSFAPDMKKLDLASSQPVFSFRRSGVQYMGAHAKLNGTGWKAIVFQDKQAILNGGGWEKTAFWSGLTISLLLSLFAGFLWSEASDKLVQAFVSTRRGGLLLRKSQDRLKTILEDIRDGYYESDLSGRLTECNDALCNILGRSRKELLSIKAREMVDPKDREEAVSVFKNVFETGEPVDLVNWQVLRKDGSQLSIEGSVAIIMEDGEKKGFKGIVRDVTPRQKVEWELARTKTFMQNLMESSFDAIVSTDLHGVIEYANPQVEQLLGYTPSEILGRRVAGYYCRGVEDAKDIMMGLNHKGGFTNHDIQMETKEGQIADVSASVSLLRNEHREVVGTLGILRDVTYHNRLEEGFQQAQKMEAIGTLAGGVAHDFNNLLMGMQGYVSLMLLDLKPDQEHFRKLKRIEDQIKSGSDLTRQLLGLARGGKYEVRPENLGVLVSNVAEMFGRTRKEIRIHLDFQDEIHAVEVDGGQMEQVLLNLFVNAWQAMPEGGDLFLKVRNLHLDDQAAGAVGIKPGDAVQVTVADTGDGMDEETCRKAFDPFFTTKKRGRGTGLGLASAYGIMKNHGGAITVESGVGKGATFKLYLPASKSCAGAQEKKEESLIRGNETILLVDDENTVLKVGAEMIQALGYTVMTASSGSEAVDYFTRHKTDIDLVILDLIMPGMSGEETFSALKDLEPQIKVLLSSGYSIEGQAERILEKGASAFVQKPFNINALSDALKGVFFV